MTRSGGSPAATEVGYFWKKRSHGMPCDSKQKSGLASANCPSISAKTAPSEPVRPCQSLSGSSHWPKALTTGVGSASGAGAAAISSAAGSAAVSPLGAGAPQAVRSSAMTINRVRPNEILRIVFLLRICETSEKTGTYYRTQQDHCAETKSILKWCDFEIRCFCRIVRLVEKCQNSQSQSSITLEQTQVEPRSTKRQGTSNRRPGPLYSPLIRSNRAFTSKRTHLLGKLGYSCKTRSHPGCGGNIIKSHKSDILGYAQPVVLHSFHRADGHQVVTDYDGRRWLFQRQKRRAASYPLSGDQSPTCSYPGGTSIPKSAIAHRYASLRRGPAEDRSSEKRSSTQVANTGMSFDLMQPPNDFFSRLIIRTEYDVYSWVVEMLTEYYQRRTGTIHHIVQIIVHQDGTEP